MSTTGENSSYIVFVLQFKKIKVTEEHFMLCSTTAVHFLVSWFLSVSSVYLFEEGLKCIVTCLLHLSVDMST